MVVSISLYVHPDPWGRFPSWRAHFFLSSHVSLQCWKCSNPVSYIERLKKVCQQGNNVCIGIIKLPILGGSNQCKSIVILRDWSLMLHSLGWCHRMTFDAPTLQVFFGVISSFKMTWSFRVDDDFWNTSPQKTWQLIPKSSQEPVRGANSGTRCNYDGLDRYGPWVYPKIGGFWGTLV